MQTAKQAMLAILKGEKADFIPEAYSTMKDVVYPGERFIDLKNFDPYGTGPDAWGVMWTNQGPNPMIDGNTVAKDFRLFEDVADWKKYVKFPKFSKFVLKMIFKNMQKGMGVNRDEHVVSCLLLSGAFERVNQMVGFENALCAFYECPDEMKELLNAIADYKIKCIELAHKTLKPDVIHMHDDWGTNDNMFFSPDIWREFIKPIEKRYADKIHELGMIYMHHSCGHIEQIIPDLVEIGVDAINPMMISNDLDTLMEKYGDKITFCGGIDSQTMEIEATPEAVTREVRKAMDKYANKGRYLPYIIPINEATFGMYVGAVTEYGRQIELK
ncbi:MAG: hypothetical protein IJ471_05060 [Eubacterium sp.]|nr:hypothetical protein [Eubacterium sp.]